MARHYSKGTQTWQIYESLFLEDSPEPDQFNEDTQRFEPVPVKFPCSSKGVALNLAMGLNACQIQHFTETGRPKHQITKSAKAKEDEQGNWYLEVSVSYRHRSKPGKASDEMSKILQQAMLRNPNNDAPEARLLRLAMASQSGDQVAPCEAAPVRPPVDDSLFESMFDLHLPKPKEKDE